MSRSRRKQICIFFLCLLILLAIVSSLLYQNDRKTKREIDLALVQEKAEEWLRNEHYPGKKGNKRLWMTSPLTLFGDDGVIQDIYQVFVIDEEYIVAMITVGVKDQEIISNSFAIMYGMGLPSHSFFEGKPVAVCVTNKELPSMELLIGEEVYVLSGEQFEYSSKVKKEDCQLIEIKKIA
ncbi:MAG: hypothetical protein IJ091_05385 [Oscillospiraceae bacterium]|nr:hypothetical protein [Oscillospiraceae bacterium]